MILRVLIGVVLGAGIGFLMGSTRSCSTGGCPLTSNPWVGMVYGAFLGGMLAGVSAGTVGGGAS
jgi:hypothetical protein